MFWPFHRRRHKADIAAAKADLERARSHRPEVDRLVYDLVRERQLNGFTANITVILRGGHQ